MLRITVEPVANEVRLRLEGDLTGTWVRDLEESWRSIRGAGRDSPPGLDLTGVTKVDDAGRYLLALIQETGATIVTSGCAMRALLESIACDWPARSAESPASPRR